MLAAVDAAEEAGALVVADAAADAVGLLALVAGQDVELVPDPDDPDGPGTWRVAQRVAPDRMISTVDPDARHAHKTTSRRQDGFKAHVVVEPDTGIITVCAVTKAAGEGSGDAAAGIALLAEDTTLPTPSPPTPPDGLSDSPPDGLSDGLSDGLAAQEPVEVFGDSAYGTGDMLAALQAARHTALVKPWPIDPAVPGGFTVDDFTVAFTADGHAATLTCPAGITRPVNRVRQVNFGAACRGCPLRPRCTRSATGKSMRIREHDALQRAHRAAWAANPEFRTRYREHRPMVERTIAWITRGNRRLRYRGTTKNNAWLQLRASAINLRRLTALGLTHDTGRWILAG